MKAFLGYTEIKNGERENVLPPPLSVSKSFGCDRLHNNGKIKTIKGRAHRNWIKKLKNGGICSQRHLLWLCKRLCTLQCPSPPLPPLSQPHPSQPAETMKLPVAFLNSSYLYFVPNLQCNSSKTSWWILLFDVSFWS